MTLSQNVDFTGSIDERFAGIFKRTVVLHCQPAGQFGDLEFWSSLRRPSVQQIVQGLLGTIYWFGHASPDPNKYWRLPEDDFRKKIAEFAHFLPPTNNFRSSILARRDPSAIKNFMRTAAFCRDGKTPAPVSREEDHG